MKNYIICLLLSFLSYGVWSQKVSDVNLSFESLIAFPDVRDIAMTAAGNEAFITAQSPMGEMSVLLHFRNLNNAWKAVAILPFSGTYNDMEPFLSQDDLTLYFVSNRPLDDGDKKAKDFDIWKVERPTLISPWGAPINLGMPINTQYNEFYPSLSENQNLYFTSDQPTELGNDNIWFSEKLAQGYGEPELLSTAINSKGYEFNAYIASDESYLIYSSYNREDGWGSGDLYLSVKNTDGSWSNATNLGSEINSTHMDYCPFVDRKSNTLYFTSKRTATNDLNDSKTLMTLTSELNKKKKVISRIYKVSLEGLIK